MINGLSYIKSFISLQEQEELIQVIDSLLWSNDLKRRTQHYGYKYDYTKKSIDPSLYLGTLPEWLTTYTKRLLDLKLFSKHPDQVIINEYLPGQGISKHVDCIPCFEDTIASLSLLSPCEMNFEHIVSRKCGSIMLGPLSLLILTGEARYEWLHSIAPRYEDKFKNDVFKRERRISLTFRKIIK